MSLGVGICRLRTNLGSPDIPCNTTVKNYIGVVVYHACVKVFRENLIVVVLVYCLEACDLVTYI